MGNKFLGLIMCSVGTNFMQMGFTRCCIETYYDRFIHLSITKYKSGNKKVTISSYGSDLK